MHSEVERCLVGVGRIDKYEIIIMHCWRYEFRNALADFFSTLRLFSFQAHIFPFLIICSVVILVYHERIRWIWSVKMYQIYIYFFFFFCLGSLRFDINRVGEPDKNWSFDLLENNMRRNKTFQWNMRWWQAKAVFSLSITLEWLKFSLSGARASFAAHPLSAVNCLCPRSIPIFINRQTTH